MSATIIKQNSFEGGANGTTLTVGSGGNTSGASGDYFDRVNIGSSNTCVFSTGWTWTGSLGCKMTQGGTNACDIGWTWTGAQADWTIHFPFKAPAKPSTNTTLIRWYSDTGYSTQIGGLLYTVTGKIQIVVSPSGDNTASTGVLTPGSDYVAQVRWISGTSLTVNVYPKGSTTPTATASLSGVTSSPVNSVRFGITTGSSGISELDFDLPKIGYGGLISRVDVSNSAPTANAGPNQTNIEPFGAVMLDGSDSSDPDAGDTLAYAWTQTAGTSVTLSDTAAMRPTFTAPATTAGETLTFSLTVTDSHGAGSAPATVNITVLPHTFWRIGTGGSVSPVKFNVKS